MNAGAVKAGGVFVEIGADPRRFFATLNRVNKAMGNMGRSLAGAGAKVGGIGVATLAPFAAAVREGASYQSTLLNIAASTGATAAELDKIKASSMAMSKELGIGPTAAAEAIKEMVKGGLTLDQVLGGAGKTAAEFSTVAEMAAGEGAVVLSKAMNAFGVGSERAANALSAAADASATSIPEIAQAFSQVSAVAASSNQSIEDTAAALAILANKGIVGSDAGTSVKTMLQRLKAPSDEAAAAMAMVGLSLTDLRDASSGKLLALPSLIGKLEQAFAGVDEITKDMAIKKIFGDDAVRAAEIFRATGKKSFEEVMAAMAGALPVSEKYKMLMSGLAGAGGTVLAAMKRFAVAISEAVGPALMSAIKPITGFIDGLIELATNNKEAVANIAKFGVAAVAIGGALTGLGLSLQAASFGFGGILKAVGALGSIVGLVVSPVGLVVAAVAGLVMLGPQLKGAFSGALDGVAEMAGSVGESFRGMAADGMVVFSDLATTATTTFNGIYEAIAAGDLSGAMDVLWAGLYAGWLRGVEALMGAVDPWLSMFQNAFTILGAEIYKVWDSMWTGIGNVMNMAGAYLMGAMDNIINPLLAAWDVLEAGIRKSWNRVQSLFKKGFNLEEENNKVDSEMAARKRKRELERPGIEGRTDKAAKENEQANKDLKDRRKAIDANTDATIAEREAANQARADERRAATQAAEANLESVSGAATAKSQDATTASELLKSLESASSLDQITNIGTSIDALLQRGNISGGVEQKLMDAYYAAFSRVNVASASASGMESQQQVESGAAAAGIGGPSQSQVVGTFSSVGLGGLGFGGSLVQKIAEYGKRTAEATEQMANEGAEVQA